MWCLSTLTRSFDENSVTVYFFRGVNSWHLSMIKAHCFLIANQKNKCIICTNERLQIVFSKYNFILAHFLALLYPKIWQFRKIHWKTGFETRINIEIFEGQGAETWARDRALTRILNVKRREYIVKCAETWARDRALTPYWSYSMRTRCIIVQRREPETGHWH